jgi:two-component system response regulator
LIVAADGVEALDYLFGIGKYQGRDVDETPHCILLDLKLPHLNGLETLRRIRTNPRTRYLPVIILTSSLEEQDIASSYDYGANSYIRKPVDFLDFIEVMKHLGVYWLHYNELAPREGEFA